MVSAVRSSAWLLSSCPARSVLWDLLSVLVLKVQLLSGVSPLSYQELIDRLIALYSVGFLFCLSVFLRCMSGEGRLCMELSFLPGAALSHGFCSTQPSPAPLSSPSQMCSVLSLLGFQVKPFKEFPFSAAKNLECTPHCSRSSMLAVTLVWKVV